MRKAFKYVSERGKREGSGRGLEGSMKRYFAEEDNADAFSVPFKYILFNEGKTRLKRPWMAIFWGVSLGVLVSLQIIEVFWVFLILLRWILDGHEGRQWSQDHLSLKAGRRSHGWEQHGEDRNHEAASLDCVNPIANKRTGCYIALRGIWTQTKTYWVIIALVYRMMTHIWLALTFI